MKRFLQTLAILSCAIFSLAASPIAPDFAEKVHIGVHSQNTSILHLADQSKSIELHQVTERNFQYDALGSTVRPGSAGQPGLTNVDLLAARNQMNGLKFGSNGGIYKRLPDKRGGNFTSEFRLNRQAKSGTHGNRLDSPGLHDVYVVRDANTNRILHFGETGRGYKTRGNEWAKKLQEEYGLDVIVRRLRTVEGKGAAKALETRYIKTYEKMFGIRPGFVDENGIFHLIQKTHH